MSPQPPGVTSWPSRPVARVIPLRFSATRQSQQRSKTVETFVPVVKLIDEAYVGDEVSLEPLGDGDLMLRFAKPTAMVAGHNRATDLNRSLGDGPQARTSVTTCAGCPAAILDTSPPPITQNVAAASRGDRIRPPAYKKSCRPKGPAAS